VKTIVCFGSSITQASGVAEIFRWPTRLQFLLEQWQPGAFQVFNKGIGGDTTARLFERFEADVLPLLPATVLLQVGGNDSSRPAWASKSRVSTDEFRRNLQAFHLAVTERGGELLFMTYHPFTSETMATYPQYATATREIAQATDSPLIDMYHGWRNRNADPDRCLMEDRVHLTAEGNGMYADVAFDMLREHYKQD
jgi:lysophospholipase L1-like esterase